MIIMDRFLYLTIKLFIEPPTKPFSWKFIENILSFKMIGSRFHNANDLYKLLGFIARFIRALQVRLFFLNIIFIFVKFCSVNV